MASVPTGRHEVRLARVRLEEKEDEQEVCLSNHIRIDVSSATNTETSQTRTQHNSNDSSHQRRSAGKKKSKGLNMSEQTQSHPTSILTLIATISHCCNQAQVDGVCECLMLIWVDGKKGRTFSPVCLQNGFESCRTGAILQIKATGEVKQ